MRPLKLVMTGFESYKDRTGINFEELGNRGLYLITGDTGAGKTTIFDAITFALYGSPSGADRNVEMLRSHFADENTPTFVELDFEANGKKYHIKRNPEYERKALRGEGITTEAANAELQPDGQEPLSGVSKVNAEIERILNLKKEQFCSIAMIAQGRFQQLLLSKKDDKECLFRELFHTEKYESLQNQLKSDKSQALAYLNELKLRMGEALSGFIFSEEDEEAEKINQIKNSSYVKEEDFEFLKNFAAKDEKKLSELISQIIENEKKLEKVNGDLQAGSERIKTEEKLTAAEKNLSEKEENLEGLKEVVTRTEKEAEKLPGLEKEKTLLEASLKKYEEISKKEDELEKLGEEIKTAEKKEIELEEKKNKYEAAIETAKVELAALKNAGEKASSYEISLEKISEEEKEIKDIEKRLSELIRKKEELVISQNKVEQINSLVVQANKKYTDLLRLFNLEQAGILAEKLEEGCECPVCGSKDHPHPAVKSSEAPNQTEIEEAKKEADRVSSQSTSLAVEAAQKKTEAANSEAEINKLLKKYFSSLSAADKELASEIVKRKESLQKDYEETEAKLLEEKKAKFRHEEIEKSLPEIESSLKQTENEALEISSKMAGLKAKLETEAKNLESEKSGLKYKTFAEAQESFMLLENQITQLKGAFESANNNRNDCEKEIENLKGEIKSLNEQLKKTQALDMEKLNKEKLKLYEEKNSMNTQRDSLSERKGINQESLRKIEALIPEIEKATDRYNMISALSDVASGSNRGARGRPSLETYVQMNCLDLINRRANLRLKKMTDNKYELRRRVEKDGSELGLDLNVKDFYTGREREVQTLSGGEQFQASLSLALGLADEVQNNSGGIKLDAMFIDEGFGTLDSETLNKAMRALEDLSQGDKLVGIISHVEELENRIPKKICVKKDASGVSHASLIQD